MVPITRRRPRPSAACPKTALPAISVVGIRPARPATMDRRAPTPTDAHSGRHPPRPRRTEHPGRRRHRPPPDHTPRPNLSSIGSISAARPHRHPGLPARPGPARLQPDGRRRFDAVPVHPVRRHPPAMIRPAGPRHPEPLVGPARQPFRGGQGVPNPRGPPQSAPLSGSPSGRDARPTHRPALQRHRPDLVRLWLLRAGPLLGQTGVPTGPQGSTTRPTTTERSREHPAHHQRRQRHGPRGLGPPGLPRPRLPERCRADSRSRLPAGALHQAVRRWTAPDADDRLTRPPHAAGAFPNQTPHPPSTSLQPARLRKAAHCRPASPTSIPTSSDKFFYTADGQDAHRQPAATAPTGPASAAAPARLAQDVRVLRGPHARPRRHRPGRLGREPRLVPRRPPPRPDQPEPHHRPGGLLRPASTTRGLNRRYRLKSYAVPQVVTQVDNAGIHRPGHLPDGATYVGVSMATDLLRVVPVTHEARLRRLPQAPPRQPERHLRLTANLPTPRRVQQHGEPSRRSNTAYIFSAQPEARSTRCRTRTSLHGPPSRRPPSRPGRCRPTSAAPAHSSTTDGPRPRVGNQPAPNPIPATALPVPDATTGSLPTATPGNAAERGRDLLSRCRAAGTDTPDPLPRLSPSPTRASGRPTRPPGSRVRPIRSRASRHHVPLGPDSCSPHSGLAGELARLDCTTRQAARRRRRFDGDTTRRRASGRGIRSTAVAPEDPQPDDRPDPPVRGLGHGRVLRGRPAGRPAAGDDQSASGHRQLGPELGKAEGQDRAVPGVLHPRPHPGHRASTRPNPGDFRDLSSTAAGSSDGRIGESPGPSRAADPGAVAGAAVESGRPLAIESTVSLSRAERTCHDRPSPSARLHPDRAAGGHRDHRRAGRPAPAGRQRRPRGGPPDPVHQQPCASSASA